MSHQCAGWTAAALVAVDRNGLSLSGADGYSVGYFPGLAYLFSLLPFKGYGAFKARFLRVLLLNRRDISRILSELFGLQDAAHDLA